MTGGGKIPCCKNDAVTVEGLGNQGVRTMKHSKIKIKGHEDAGYWNSCETVPQYPPKTKYKYG